MSLRSCPQVLPALLSSPLEVELHRINASLGAKKSLKKVAPTLPPPPPGAGKKRKCRTGLEKTKTVQGSAIATKKKLPVAVRWKIGGLCGADMKLILIMEKKLTKSDLDRNLGRLSLPRKKIPAAFLEQEERHDLENRGEITIPIIEPCLRISNLTFKNWKPFYALTKGWNAIAHNKNNGLKKGDLIQLWSFRTGGSVGFAVVKA